MTQRIGIAVFCLGATVVAAPAVAADYLEAVESPVFEAPGDHAALTRRAATCLAQNEGLTGQSIQTDAEGGTVVGPLLFSYSSAGVPWSVRSTLTIVSKDGRFRMTHSALSHKQGGPAVSGWSIFSGSLDQGSEGGWMRVGKWKFSGADKVEAAAQALSLRIATCIQAVPSNNW